MNTLKITKKSILAMEKKKRKEMDIDWSLKIKQQDNFVCAICGSKEFLNSHHLFPREIKKYRWDLNNGICLCRNHHKFSFEVSAHRNPLAFFGWMMKNRQEQLMLLLSG